MPCRVCIQLCSPALDCCSSSAVDLKLYERCCPCLSTTEGGGCYRAAENCSQPASVCWWERDWINQQFLVHMPVSCLRSEPHFPVTLTQKNLWSFISSHPLKKKKDFCFWMTLPYSGTIAWSFWHCGCSLHLLPPVHEAWRAAEPAPPPTAKTLSVMVVTSLGTADDCDGGLSLLNAM